MSLYLYSPLNYEKTTRFREKILIYVFLILQIISYVSLTSLKRVDI
jgi:hypothetical protein